MQGSAPFGLEFFKQLEESCAEFRKLTPDQLKNLTPDQLNALQEEFLKMQTNFHLRRQESAQTKATFCKGKEVRDTTYQDRKLEIGKPKNVWKNSPRPRLGY